MSRHNGFANEETYFFAVWYGHLCANDIDVVREHLESEIDAMPQGYLRDVLTQEMASVKWEELKSRDGDYSENNNE